MAVPKLRFKGFISDWDSIHILDIAHTYIGLVTTMTENYVEKGTLLIRNSDIKENCFSFEKKIFLDEEFANNNANRKHCEGDVITVHTGDIGTSAVIDKSMEGSIGFATIVTRVKDKSRYNSKYISWYYNSPIYKKYALRMSTGDGRNNLNMKDFNKAYIPVPCFEEQNKIADFLTTFDKRITVQQNIVADLEETKKGLLQKIFSREIRFKDANGQDYPDWKEKRLVAISELITVGIANSATHAYTENGVVMFRNLNIKPNELDELDIIHISTEFAQKYEKKKLQENDILVCRTGYPGTACIVPKKYSGAQTFTTLIVRLNHAEADVKYVCQYINSDIGKKYFESTQIGGGQKNSGAGILSKMPIKIPCMEEQRKIADFLSTFDKKITAEKQILSDLLEIKKGLLQQMFV